ncbi:hypothetical protein KAFR_0A02600 [Kazachstania africana CBS 2517]|uniref:AMP-activated protein kinase glycogen-binding domain-containing protein n=1 Tax=Kazachstania africana (strain ATCC 22294 / BCRC 22015 / CBS 2517 / CECT 1963 / NBRC 1671 / NRRL Y-8276) TaxID=1071382 RepID=H2AMU6_KAZAF|nr:hypothetical protein KAFR_0A02600 [Kazachstania africana CBS 2517]CCF55696.1 hypothetical protein KAFR_0A02600 [Kazachstania africana CBS 2517]
MAGVIKLTIPVVEISKELGHDITSIRITGDFDNWEHTDSRYINLIDPAYDTVDFEIESPVDCQQNLNFKFIIDDKEWITTGLFNKMRDVSGNLNNSIKAIDYLETTTDFINISSMSELSSTEEINFNKEDEDTILQNDEFSSTQSSSNYYNRKDKLRGIVSFARNMVSYWHKK